MVVQRSGESGSVIRFCNKQVKWLTDTQHLNGFHTIWTTLISLSSTALCCCSLGQKEPKCISKLHFARYKDLSQPNHWPFELSGTPASQNMISCEHKGSLAFTASPSSLDYSIASADVQPLLKHNNIDSQTKLHARPPVHSDIAAIFWNTVILWEAKITLC